MGAFFVILGGGWLLLLLLHSKIQINLDIEFNEVQLYNKRIYSQILKYTLIVTNTGYHFYPKVRTLLRCAE